MEWQSSGYLLLQELGMPKESWVSWWREEMEQRCNIVWHHKLIIVLRLLRFPLLAAGIISCVATYGLPNPFTFRKNGPFCVW